MKPTEKGIPNPDICASNSFYIEDYHVLGPSDILPLVPKFSLELHKLWEDIPHWIIKADIARLLYIYFNGGTYMDCDCKIIKKFDTTPPVTLFIESIVNIKMLGPREIKHPAHAVRIANYAFSSVAGHPFLKLVLDECIRRLKILPNKITPLDILWVCGPDVITTVYHKNKHLFNIVLLDSSYLEHYANGSWR
jgi:mannosyltransferase OCH1-like enzyme